MLDYVKLVNRMNNEYYADYPEFQIRFRPRFTWDNNKAVVIKLESISYDHIHLLVFRCPFSGDSSDFLVILYSVYWARTFFFDQKSQHPAFAATYI